MFVGVDSAVHQALHRRADDVPALPEDIECNDYCERRVENLRQPMT